MAREDRIRTITKAIGYRILSVIAIFLTIQVLTGSTGQSIQLAIWTNIVTSLIYYGWERTWDKIDWRRQ